MYKSTYKTFKAGLFPLMSMFLVFSEKNNHTRCNNLLQEITLNAQYWLVPGTDSREFI